jgi:hypothetical protein
MKTPTHPTGVSRRNGLPAFWHRAVGCAASLAFAVVFAPVLATAQALAIVVAFARVFWKWGFFSVSHSLERNARMAGRARGVGSHCR